MSHSNPVKFPGQELEKSLDKIQGILHTAKSLVIQLVSYEKIKEAIANYIEAVQVFLSNETNAANEHQEKVERKGKQTLDESMKRQEEILKLREEREKKGCLTPERQKKLDQLINEEEGE